MRSCSTSAAASCRSKRQAGQRRLLSEQQLCAVHTRAAGCAATRGCCLDASALCQLLGQDTLLLLLLVLALDAHDATAPLQDKH